MKLRVALVLLLVCLSVVVFSCRRNPPSLIDANRPPDTELWYAPPDSTEYDYLVHMYWRGMDADGTTPRYIWTITDTLVTDPLLRWNPSERLADYRSGRITTRTDSVFSFEGFKNVAGVGLRKNRQAFHIAAIDDEGVLDPFPAAIEFVATVGELPEMRFATAVTRSDGNTSTVIRKPYNPSVLDTVGMYRPFWISYHGWTVNGEIRQYIYYPLTSGVLVAGQNEWNDDLTDTLRFFPNDGDQVIPSGMFRFAAQCMDDASAESRVDVKDYREGVAQLVVNFEPDTRIFNAVSTYYIFFQEYTDTVRFDDGVPDTVPYNSWLRIDYRGWDSPYDSSLCADDVNKCLGYQVQYSRTSSRNAGSNSKSRWLPNEPKDDNPFGTTDSTSMNMGSLEYQIRARTVDEYGKPDGVPDQVEVVANYDPTLDETRLFNWDGTVVGPPGESDTLLWDWTNPANSPDTIEFDIGTGQIFVVKDYYFDIEATGHDHPKENVNFGVRNWYYLFSRTDNGNSQKFGRSGAWVSGPSPNVLSDRYEANYRYNLIEDPGGQSILDNPPSFWDSEYHYSIYGRDIPTGEEFNQYMWVGEEQRQLNSYQTARLGRWTETKEFVFYLRMNR
ncbi:MAG: hypothetical protein JSW50_00745 [Candidatus Latescibacterota bacterium]|nr:MAG: hypothetical protein JSW50_00745 [Candidatus Latescibacterota bacterium]